MSDSQPQASDPAATTSSSGDQVAAAPDIAISDRYRVQREVGRGGMATVYAARDMRYDREVAVKVLSPELAAGLASERFLLEIAVVAKLTHPHIVPLLDSGETQGRLWFVMPMIEGATLRGQLEHERQLQIGDAVRIAREVAAALAYAHSHGVVHRDIKPENVLISGGSAAVADFGLVKVLAAAGTSSLTRTGTSVGTTYYMSPEQASGAEFVDGRTDIYSLGCMLYELLTGEPPYTGGSPQSVIAKHFTDPVPRARRLRDTITPALDDVIARAMAKLPADRWPDASSFAEALQRAVDSGSHASYSALSSSSGAASAGSVRVAGHASLTRRSLIGVGILAAVASAGWFAFRGRSAPAAPVGAPRAIAVLPFTNLNPSKDEEYFSVGMTDELLVMLSAIDGLRVAARASSYAFKDRAGDVAEIGAKLKVDAILEGSVRREGDHVKVLAELVSVADGSTLWRQQFDRTLSNVFALQEEIARAIVSALRISLAAGQTLSQRTTGDVEAYQLYMRGRYAWNQRTPASLEQAAAWFRQAVDRDPQYARAWAGIADVHIVQALNFFEPPGENFAMGKAAALKALALDSTLAEAHASLGTVHFLYDRDWTAADDEYRRALALDPAYSSGHYFYALFLSSRDRNAEAAVEAARALALDPLSPPIAQVTGIISVQSGRYADAIAPLRAAIALQPQYYFPHTWLAIALAMTGATAEAVAEAKRAVELAPSNTLVGAIEGFVHALVGNRAAALASIADLEVLGTTRPIPLHYIAKIYDVLGDAPRALSYIRRAVDAGEGQLSQLMREPALRTIGNDPEFLLIAKQLGIK